MKTNKILLIIAVSAIVMACSESLLNEDGYVPGKRPVRGCESAIQLTDSTALCNGDTVKIKR